MLLIESDVQTQVDDYLRQDRQWRREHRIAHAQYQLSSAKLTDDERTFWTAVLKANET